MTDQQDTDNGPDLSLGIPISDIPASGLLKGHIGGDAVVLARSGDEFFAIGASCTHYHASLGDGSFDGEIIRCPWHHAHFSVRTGEAVRAPAIDPVPCISVEQRDGKVFVTGKKEPAPRRRKTVSETAPSRIVIVGGGAAAFAAAEMLRRERYQGSIVMLSDDDAAPVDRPNLSKDYLAGNAPQEWVPLRPQDWYRDNGIDLRLNTRVEQINVHVRELTLRDDSRVQYDRLLLATGAEPVQLDVPGANQPHVHVLRSFRHCCNIITAAQEARRAVVIGASFIGLEVAAALRARNLEVHVVAPDKLPLQKVFAPEMGSFVRALHEEHGVVFHLEDTVTAIEGRRVQLKSGTVLDADLVVVGIGVRPRVELAEKAGLKLDRGVSVNEYLETSAPGILAAGDIARWPDRRIGESIRVEHWVVDERQGQAAAHNMLGARPRYDDVPFFWSQHYDVPINYVGHATEWDAIDIDGDIGRRDCLVRYRKNGQIRAVASIYRDLENLAAEMSMEGGLST